MDASLSDENRGKAAVAESALRESEERYHALVAATSDIVLTADGGGMVHDVPSWRKLTGQTRDEVRGDGWLDAIHPDDRERVTLAWRRACSAGRTMNADFRVRGSDGSFRWYRARTAPLFDAGGKPREWIGALNDIDAEKRAGLEEREETTVLEALHGLGATLASELDPSRIERTVIRSLSDLTAAGFGAMAPGFSGGIVRSDDVLSDPRFAGKSPFADWPADDAPLRSYLAVPIVSRTGETLGGLVVGHSEPGAFSERDERVALSVASWASVSLDNARLYKAERRARADAEAANKAKSAFLASMSHELRTPLNAIGGYADLLQVGVHGELTDMQHRDVSRIKRSQRHLLSLINDILNFVKIEAGKVEYATRPVLLTEHLPELETLIAPQLREKEIKYVLHCTDPTCSVYADPDKMQQILLNLLSNAIKFTEPGGRITLGCSSDGNTVGIHVRDTGVGIAPSKLDAIFEPFIQLDRGTTSHHEGTGLGLSISRDLARAMGGDLTITSEVGEGSVFTLMLPMRLPARPAPRAASPDQPSEGE